MQQRRFQSISSLLIRRIMGVALACLFVVTGIQALYEYHLSERDFSRAVEDVGNNSVPLLSLSLWDIEPDAVQRHVNWLASLPEIGAVRVRASTGQVFEAGDAVMVAQPPTQAIAIWPPHGSLQLGLLEIWADPGYFSQHFWRSAAGWLPGYVLFTLLLCVMVAQLMRRHLRQPMKQIAQFAAELRPQEMARPLVVARPSRNQVDEIDLVIQGFQHLQAEVQGHIDHLDRMVAERTLQLESALEEVRRMSLTDALTGCFNRRVIDERLPGEIERARRYGRPLSVVFVDVDHFKQVNDDMGHAAGDDVLRDIAGRLQRALRDGVDWVARYGGEEFVIILPECDVDAARGIAERLREDVAAAELDINGRKLKVTASLGVAQCAPGEGMADLLARADAMLYHAKIAGRNQVCVSA